MLSRVRSGRGGLSASPEVPGCLLSCPRSQEPSQMLDRVGVIVATLRTSVELLWVVPWRRGAVCLL